MIKLSLEHINAKSPYEVREAGGGYEFRSEGGILYRIRFLEENPIGGCDTYQFAISKIDNVRSPHEPNISAITFIIIDEFFSEYENVLLYYCDSADHREAGRNRLFIRWFEKAANPNRFTIRTTHATVEGQELYVAIIVENRNSRLKAITDEFDSTAALLTDKPKSYPLIQKNIRRDSPPRASAFLYPFCLTYRQGT